MERIERIKLLLLTMDDYLPTIRSSSPRTESGFVNFPRYYDCPDCSLNGFISSACETCQGRGRIPGPNKDPYDTGIAQAFMGEQEQKRRDESQARDSRLERIEKYNPSDDTFAWENRKTHFDKHGSYQELRTALVRLKIYDQMLYKIIHSRYLDHVEKKVVCTRLEQEALQKLSELMPKRIRVPIWILKESKTIKQESLLSLLQAGMSTKKIALRLGMSQRKVKRLIKAQKKPPPGGG